MKYSIVIPCYNEAGNIPALLGRLEKSVGREDAEVILVDNNSKDETAEVLKNILEKFPFARSIEEKHPGYGRAVASGLRAAKGEWYIWTHADLQCDPEDLVRAMRIMEQEEDPKNAYVKGKRRGRPLTDKFFTAGMGVFESALFGKILWDINAQPNCFHKSFFESWEDPPEDFALDLYALLLAKKRGYRVKRFRVDFRKRVHGVSSWNTGFGAQWKFIKRTLAFSVRLKRKVKKGRMSWQ